MNTKRNYTDIQFIEAVKTSYSIAQVLKNLNLFATGSNYRNFKIRVKKLNIDISHFTGQGHLKGKTHNWTKSIPFKDILVKNSLYKRGYLKKRLLKEGIFENKCYNCNLTEWMNKPLSIQLEHKNGINNDNRKENLTFLCPNCHSQTSTYAGKNGKRKLKKYYCSKCDKKISRSSKSGLCVKCVRIKK